MFDIIRSRHGLTQSTIFKLKGPTLWECMWPSGACRGSRAWRSPDDVQVESLGLAIGNLGIVAHFTDASPAVKSADHM